MENEAIQQLMRRYNSGGAFTLKMQTIANKYLHYEQMALYSSTPNPKGQPVIALDINNQKYWQCPKKDRCRIYFLLGCKLSGTENPLEDFLQVFAKSIPKPKEPYSIVYINTNAQNSRLSHFKNILSHLPIEYLIYLESVYVVKASFKDKAFQLLSFDFVRNYINNKITYLSKLSKLLSYVDIKQSFFNQFPQEVLDQNEKKFISKSKIGSSTKICKKIEQYEMGRYGAPLIIELLLYYLSKSQPNLKLQGLFRKSANIEQQTQLLRQLEKQNYNYLEDISDGHLVANGIKRFLSNLQQPIIPYAYYQQMMQNKQNSYQQIVIKTVNKLDHIRKITLFLLFDFFKTKILPQQIHNSMTIQNIGIVMGPCLMRSQVASIKDLFNAPKVNQAVQIILNSFETIFGNKQQRMRYMRTSTMNNSAKELKQSQLYSEFQKYDELVFEQQVKLTPEQQQNLEESDNFLQAFQTKKK